jgi:hypothetical protein
MRHAFSNYRNLAKRAEATGHHQEELRLLQTCLAALARPGSEQPTAQTVGNVFIRIAELELELGVAA